MLTVTILAIGVLIAVTALVVLVARRTGTHTAEGRGIEADRTSRTQTRDSAGVYSVHAHSPWPGKEENSRYHG